MYIILCILLIVPQLLTKQKLYLTGRLSFLLLLGSSLSFLLGSSFGLQLSLRLAAILKITKSLKIVPNYLKTYEVFL
jgi:hypothetical protein